MLTPEALQAWWRDLNVRYFVDGLPPIPIIWSQRLTSSAGLFLYTVGPRAPMISSETFAKHRLIRLSIPLLYNQPAAEVRGTLAHEMIHQLAADSGLLPRHDAFPYWLHEGFAAQFEVIRGGRWAGISRAHDLRLPDWRDSSSRSPS